MVTIVYPYVESYAKFDELLYSIRSMDAHFKDEYNLIVIGDKPKWLNDKATFINSPVISKFPVQDVVNKMKQVIAREDVSESFIWMNDDIYFMNDVTLDELKVPKAIEDLDQIWSRKQGKVLKNTNYRINMWNTFMELKGCGLPAINTCTHLPFYYNKALLGLVLERHNVADNKFLITLLYHNNLYKRQEYQFVNNFNGYKAAVYQNRVTSVMQLEQKCRNAKFFNHSDTGYKRSYNTQGKSIIEQFLRNKFSNKSKFEL